MSEMKILTYMGKPLVRQGQYLFYGDPEDKAILFMNILETKKDGELDVASKVLVQIQSTDDSLGFNEKVIKQCEKKSFYEKHPWICGILASVLAGAILLFSFWENIVKWIEGWF